MATPLAVYIWQRVDHCSDSYHSEGGVVAVAETEAEARAMANAVEGCAIRADEHPDVAVPCMAFGQAKRVFIMPNAGCC